MRPIRKRRVERTFTKVAEVFILECFLLKINKYIVEKALVAKIP